MHAGRIVQAVILMLIVALAASCATTNEYVSKVFKPGNADSTGVVKATKQVRFLDIDTASGENVQWVKTETAEDSVKEVKSVPVVADTKPIPVPDQPVAKTTTGPGGVRSKTKRD